MYKIKIFTFQLPFLKYSLDRYTRKKIQIMRWDLINRGMNSADVKNKIPDDSCASSLENHHQSTWKYQETVKANWMYFLQKRIKNNWRILVIVWRNYMIFPHTHTHKSERWLETAKRKHSIGDAIGYIRSKLIFDTMLSNLWWVRKSP